MFFFLKKQNYCLNLVLMYIYYEGYLTLQIDMALVI